MIKYDNGIGEITGRPELILTEITAVLMEVVKIFREKGMTEETIDRFLDDMVHLAKMKDLDEYVKNHDPGEVPEWRKEKSLS